MVEIEQLYKEYLRSRKDDSEVGIQTIKRIRSKIALLLTGDPESKKWYEEKLNSSARGFSNSPSPRYIDVALTAKDSAFNTSIAESFVSTEHLNSLFNEIKEKIFTAKATEAIVRIGSSAWAQNYDVKLMETTSDLDLEVIVDINNFDPSEFNFIEGLQEQLTQFISLFLKGEADYFSFHTNKNAFPISMHFIPKKTLEYACNIDYETLEESKTLKEFRTKPKSKPPIYTQRNAVGKAFQYHMQPQQIPEGFITETPLMMVEKGELVLGLLLDKYFSYPEVHQKSNFFTSNIRRMKKNIAKRIQREGGSFSQMPSRKKRIPLELLDDLDAEMNQLISETIT